MVEISVIVPVYNVERYLNKCIESILCQTFQNYELILIDDGSTDQSGALCDQYAEKHVRVRTIHEVHSGVAEARNRGLKEKTGKYVAFVDADDWIDIRYLEILYRLIRQYQADLIISRGIRVQEGKDDRKRGMFQGLSETDAQIISRSEAYRRMLLCEQDVMVVPWAKLYHSRLFLSFQYPTGEIYEDLKMINKIIEGCNRIVCTSYAGYFYLSREGSIVHGKMSPGYMVSVKNAKQMWDFARMNYPEIADAAELNYCRSCFILLNRMMENPGYRKECSLLRRKMIKETVFYLSSGYADLTEKIGMLCLWFGLPCYRIAWRIRKRWSK